MFKTHKKNLVLLFILINLVNSQSFNDEFKCTKDGKFAAFDCKKYFECIFTGTLNSYKVLRICPVGLLFDNTLQICNWPYLVNCEIELTTISFINSVNITTDAVDYTTDIVDFTTEEIDYTTDIIDFTTDSIDYTTDIIGNTTDILDSITDSVDFSTDTIDFTTDSIDYTTDIIGNTTDILDSITVDVTMDASTSILTPNPEKNFKCMSDGFFPVFQCQKYYQCIFTNTLNEKKILNSCPVGLLWDTTIKACNWAYRVKCEETLKGSFPTSFTKRVQSISRDSLILNALSNKFKKSSH